MKKIYAILVAALFSVGMFAQTAPTPTDLANANYDVVNNVVLCVHFVGEAEVCNDIYFVGTPNNWAKGEGSTEDFANCVKFRALQGFDGWYAAQYEYAEGFQGKPVQAKSDGSFSWDFQTGDPAAWTHIAGLEADIVDGFGGEANISYGAAGAYIYEVSYWKNHRTPCVAAVKHDYTIYLYAPECEDAEYIPAVIGGFNNWAEGVQMNADIDGDGEVVYVATFNDEEGHAFKFRQAGISDWSNQILVYDEENDGYKENPNITLGEETTITLDYRTGKWSACGQIVYDDTEEFDIVVTLKAPANAPAAGVEIIGTFDDWKGTMMVAGENNTYTATVRATAAKLFKFREAGSWDNEIVDAATGKGFSEVPFGSVWNEADHTVLVDYSGADYVWKANYQGIEEVVLTEKAKKVVVDGVLYIVRDHKMFNIQGAQVR